MAYIWFMKSRRRHWWWWKNNGACWDSTLRKWNSILSTFHLPKRQIQRFYIFCLDVGESWSGIVLDGDVDVVLVKSGYALGWFLEYCSISASMRAVPRTKEIPKTRAASVCNPEAWLWNRREEQVRYGCRISERLRLLPVAKVLLLRRTSAWTRVEAESFHVMRTWNARPHWAINMASLGAFMCNGVLMARWAIYLTV